jgi:hypothetical protein
MLMIRFKKVFGVGLRVMFNQLPELDVHIRLWYVVVCGGCRIIDLIHKLIVAFGSSVRANEFLLLNNS